MKSILSKLRKPYEVYLDRYFRVNSSDQLEIVEQPLVYSTTHLYPTETISPSSTIEVPLEVFDIPKKALKLIYRIQSLDHTSRKVYTRLRELKSIYYWGTESKAGFNINLIIKSVSHYVKLKLILNHIANDRKCSKSVKSYLRLNCSEIFSKRYSSISKVLEDLYNKKLTLNVLNELQENSEFVKSVIVVHVKELV